MGWEENVMMVVIPRGTSLGVRRQDVAHHLDGFRDVPWCVGGGCSIGGGGVRGGGSDGGES